MSSVWIRHTPCMSDPVCIAVCCSVLRCVAALRCVKVCCGVVIGGVISSVCMGHVQHVNESYTMYGWSSVLQCVVVRCSVLRCVAMCCSVLWCVAVLQCCGWWSHVQYVVSRVQCVAVCCSVLQCVAVQYVVSRVQCENESCNIHEWGMSSICMSHRRKRRWININTFLTHFSPNHRSPTSAGPTGHPKLYGL